jgi:hypothetical protein
METYVKLCPDCQTATALQAQRCHECGHVYRTQFDPATGQVLSRRPARAAQAPGIAWMAIFRQRAQLALRLLQLLLTYAGPLLIVAGMSDLRDSQAAPALLPVLAVVLIIWLWYLSAKE